MVNQLPDETDVMPPTCQPPTIWLSTAAGVAHHALAMADRQLIQITEDEPLPDVEVRIPVFRLRILEVAEVATVLRSQIGVRSDVERMRPGVRSQKGQTVREALLGSRLQRIVV